MAASTPGSKPSPSLVTNKPFVLVPLYIYPFPTAWEPLYVAVDSHPELDFLVVVNPNSGPGPDILPDANYIEALARLTAAPNVKVIGYVHCSYGKRLLDEIVVEVSAYRGWTHASESREDGKTIVVDGIFFDEVPSSTVFVQYMTSLSNATKTILNRNPAPVDAGYDADPSDEANDVSAEELDLASPTSTASPASPRSRDPASPTASRPPAGPPAPPPPANSTAIVIYNPGVVVDPIFYLAADYIVAFENASRQWNAPVVTQGFSRLPRPLRKKSIAVAHSAAGGPVEIGQLSRKCYELGCSGQFITTRPGYEEWCPSWPEFVQEVARRTAI
ncbi:hypothetical protein J7T55_014050 [Diaporthe amygdali]|uniref:uncharacterized protein n=1 Tax=Phomopsis amygdali TaxID=1214568 RepID=UPI0022FEB7E3|nr:uncharacterized protein J7T55_014050 [Diaporthe amygdali]KAJ0119845.1 hypothetical protein J7T55_014050 [Diaporthe amygdali]